MISSSNPPAPSSRRPFPGTLCVAPSIAVLLALGGCQPAEPPRSVTPATVAAAPAAPAAKATESAVKSLLLQYQDAGALLRNGFQIAEEGGIVALDQFEKWTPAQLREMLQFVESPTSGLSETTARELARAVRTALADKKDEAAKEPASAATRTPAAPPKAGS